MISEEGGGRKAREKKTIVNLARLGRDLVNATVGEQG